MVTKYKVHAEVKQYTALSDGRKRIYSNADGRSFNRTNARIPDPKAFTYSNLFINAVLHPSSHYRIKKGRLILCTVDIPEANTPIILQFIRLTVRPVRARAKRPKDCASFPIPKCPPPPPLHTLRK